MTRPPPLRVTDDDDGRVVVQSLFDQLPGQSVPTAGAFLLLRALVLEPDFDLRLVQFQLASEAVPLRVLQVHALAEGALQGGELRRREGGAEPLRVGGGGGGSGGGHGGGGGGGGGRGGGRAAILLQLTRARAYNIPTGQ